MKSLETSLRLFIANQSRMETFGEVLATLLEPGDVIGLCGDLGAGKTFLSGAIAHGLGVPRERPITSPTFVLIHEHTNGRLPVYHMDLYRLGDASELYELGLWEYYDGAGVCLVEWCDRFEDLWPERALVISIGLGKEEERILELFGTARGAVLCQALAEALPELILSP